MNFFTAALYANERGSGTPRLNMDRKRQLHRKFADYSKLRSNNNNIGASSRRQVVSIEEFTTGTDSNRVVLITITL